MTDPGQPRRTDPVVDRVNELMTTFLDLTGALLLAAAAAWGVWRMWGPGWALAAGGLAVVVLSGLAQWRSRPPRFQPQPARQHAEPPGPSDPGNLHVAGR